MTRNPAQTTAEQATWAVLLAVASAIGSSVFACVTPFAAFAVGAAYVLPARAAVAATVGVWLANQAIGFGYLHYPWDQNTILWGFAIGAAAVVATMLASMVLRQMRHGIVAASAAALLVAFLAYEAALFLVALVLGGVEAFAPSIVGQFALLNLAWAVGLIACAEANRYLGTLKLVAGRGQRRTV